MKKLSAISAILITSASVAFAAPMQSSPTSQIPLGPRMLVYALNQAHTGTLQIESVGLEETPPVIQLDLTGLSSQEILNAFSLEGISLRFKNPSEYTATRGEILDINGKVLFRAQSWWSCQKTFNEKGKAIYQIPEWAGNLWFSLQDISVPFDGQSAVVYMNEGEILTLDVYDGQMTIPGWLAYSQGTLEVTSIDGQKKFFDIQTGVPVINSPLTLAANGSAFDNLQALGDVSDFISIDAVHNTWNQTTFEAKTSLTGNLVIQTQQIVIYDNSNIDIWPPIMSDAPVGMWLCVNNQWKYFTSTNGTFNVPVQSDKLIYFYFVWNDDTSGKG